MQVPYSRLMHGLAQENIQVNRKVLSELAMHEPYSFQALVSQVRYFMLDRCLSIRHVISTVPASSSDTSVRR